MRFESKRSIAAALTGVVVLVCFWVLWQRFEYYNLIQSIGSASLYLPKFQFEDVHGNPKLTAADIAGKAITTNFISAEIGFTRANVQGFYAIQGSVIPFKMRLVRKLNSPFAWDIDELKMNIFLDLVDAGLEKPKFDSNVERRRIKSTIVRDIKRYCGKDITEGQLDLNARKVWNYTRQMYSTYKVRDESFPVVTVISQWTTWGKWLHVVWFKQCYLETETAQN